MNHTDLLLTLEAANRQTEYYRRRRLNMADVIAWAVVARGYVPDARTLDAWREYDARVTEANLTALEAQTARAALNAGARHHGPNCPGVAYCVGAHPWAL